MKIFHTIKRFLRRESCSEGLLPNSKKGDLSRWASAMHFIIVLLAGCLMAAAFPPLNATFCVFIALTVLWLEARNRRALTAAFMGWIWGMGYALCSFFWLREIHAAVPWLLMVVLGAYYIPAGLMAALANRWILLRDEERKSGFSTQQSCRDFPLWRQLLWCLVMASTMVVVEYLRSRVLPWNYIGSAFCRNAVMMQLIRFTGVYGLTMLTALFNAALALALLTVARKDPVQCRIRYHRPWPLLIVLLLLAANMAYGIYSLRERRREYFSWQNQLRMTLVQGNLSQRRMGGQDSAFEALNTYCRLTRNQSGIPTDLIVWPETAVNYPLRGAAAVCTIYREQVRALAREFNAPLLIGTLEFDQTTEPAGSLNSAVLTDDRNILSSGYIAQYSKVHPVPFGEYVPMRRYLPDFIVDLIDMQRDLTPGKSLDPIQLNDQIRLGVNICFEDVFTYISRAEAFRGANLLLVITNDAWYPTSSEPEQHLANSVARAIENNLPMVRCGNDSASCLISPGGEIIWSLAGALQFDDGKPFRRGSGSAVISVKVPAPEQIKRTFYSRYGDWLVLLSALCVAAALLRVLQGRLSFAASLRNG
ncbi:MAG: apolipoprotein N-acyltransferase [Lentisphaerae bacterium]|nr:apolipoprotein N-acyltransferase [Lentisphaerota bacterium]